MAPVEACQRDVVAGQAYSQAVKACGHNTGLENFAREIAIMKVECKGKECKQSELANYFEEKLCLLSEAAKKAEQKLEASRLLECPPEIQSCSVANASSEAAAEAENAAAQETHAAMTAAVDMLRERAALHLDEAAAAERFLDTLKIENKASADEKSEAEMQCRKAQVEAATASAAVVACLADSKATCMQHVELQGAAAKANEHLRNQEAVVAALAARFQASEAVVCDEAAKHAALLVAYGAVEHELQEYKQHWSELFAQAFPGCASKLHDSRDREEDRRQQGNNLGTSVPNAEAAFEDQESEIETHGPGTVRYSIESFVCLHDSDVEEPELEVLAPTSPVNQRIHQVSSTTNAADTKQKVVECSQEKENIHE
jgi:hypothetical protein